MSDRLRVIIASDLEHQEVVAEIYDGELFVALVSHDEGIPTLEFPGQMVDESCVQRRISIPRFMDAVAEATQRLTE